MWTQIFRGFCVANAGRRGNSGGRPVGTPSTATAVSLGVETDQPASRTSAARLGAGWWPQPPQTQEAGPTASGRPSNKWPPCPPREKLPGNHAPLSLFLAASGPRPSQVDFRAGLLRPGQRRPPADSRFTIGWVVFWALLVSLLQGRLDLQAGGWALLSASDQAAAGGDPTWRLGGSN